MYGVVVCSKCGRPKAADLERKTTKCQCGYRIDLKSAVVRFERHSALEVADAVRAMTAGASGDDASGHTRDPLMMAVEAASMERGKWGKASRIAAVLTEEQGEFSAEDFGRASEMSGLDRPADLLMGLMDQGLVTERERNRYSCV